MWICERLGYGLFEGAWGAGGDCSRWGGRQPGDAGGGAGSAGAELDSWGCGGAGGAGGMKGQRCGKENAPQQVLGGVSLSFQQTWSGLSFAILLLLRRSWPETIVDHLPTPLLSLVASLTARTR